MSSTTLQTFELEAGHPRNAKVPHVAYLKSPYISLIIAPRDLACQTHL